LGEEPAGVAVTAEFRLLPVYGEKMPPFDEAQEADEGQRWSSEMMGAAPHPSLRDTFSP